MSIRTIFEKLSKGVTLRRRLPIEFGRARLTVSPESGGLKYWKPGLGSVDPGLLRLARAVQRGMAVWDIGANVGLFTFAAAFRAGPAGTVLAIEPDVDNVRLLAKSKMSVARDPGYASVDILSCAVSGPESRAARFEVSARARSSNALKGYGNSQMGAVQESRWVATVTVDDLIELFPPPHIVKVDVEGAEVLVLQGATRMLREIRPVFFLEVTDHASAAVTEILRKSGYSLHDGDAERPFAVSIPNASWNCIAVPTERIEVTRGWI